MYDVTNEDRNELVRRFKHHPPKGNQADRYEANRLGTAGLAMLYLKNCPPSAERDNAIKHIEEAMFWANASIARNEVHLSIEDIVHRAYAQLQQRLVEQDGE